MDLYVALQEFLSKFPDWGEYYPQSEDNPPVGGKAGLFPQGRKHLGKKENLLGDRANRIQETFLLRWQAPVDHKSAQWLRKLQAYMVNGPAGSVQAQWRGENGRLVHHNAGGLGQYEMSIIAEYMEGA